MGAWSAVRRANSGIGACGNACLVLHGARPHVVRMLLCDERLEDGEDLEGEVRELVRQRCRQQLGVGAVCEELTPSLHVVLLDERPLRNQHIRGR